MKTSNYLMSLCLFVLLFTACKNDDGVDTSTEKSAVITLTRGEKVMAEKGTDFAFKLFKEINASKQNSSNWMVSPLSISYSLGMMANGAAENTLSEITDATGFGSSLDDMNVFHQKLGDELKFLDKNVQLGIANSIWINNGFFVYDTFKEINKEMYEAQISNLDFASPQATSVINDWIAKQTNNRIKEAIKQVTDENVVILLNALYFKGSWKYKFKETETKEMDFNNADGSKSKVKMMQQRVKLKTTINDSFIMAEFPYGNGSFSMTVLLPHEHTTVEKCMEELDTELWESWLNRTGSSLLNIQFPRFELNDKYNLIEVMKEMGIKDAFSSEAADFSNMSENDIYFNIFDQAVSLKTDEEGTEAYSVTISGTGYGSSAGTPFNMNRPFTFFITENSTGIILFMGVINKL